MTGGALAVQGSATQAQQGGQGDDAVKLLKDDHRKVEQLFSRFENEDDEERKQQIARQVCQELIVHTKLEERIFYPACREQGVEDDMLDEAQVEHDGAKVLITELLMQQPGDEYYDAKFKVLSEYIKHHVREEEKSDGIFAKAKSAGMDMKALGQRLASRKQQLMAQPGADDPEPPPFQSLEFVDNQQSYYRKEEETMNRGSNYRDRDEQGRFTSDDDDRGGSRSSGRYARSRYEDDDDYRGGGRSSRSGGRSRYEDDDNGRGQGRGGWFGDSEGHSEASRRGWEEGHRGQSSRSSRGRYDDDEDRGGRRGGNGGRGGWFGDSEGHSEASRRGWERSDHEGTGWYGDRRGHSEASRRGWERSDHEGSGWYGDPEGHSEAARRGWEEGHRGQQSRGGSRSRYEDDDDDRGGRSRGGSRGGSSGGRGHGGWFGDSEGHSEASRRGWRNRD